MNSLINKFGNILNRLECDEIEEAKDDLRAYIEVERKKLGLTSMSERVLSKSIQESSPIVQYEMIV